MDASILQLASYKFKFGFPINSLRSRVHTEDKEFKFVYPWLFLRKFFTEEKVADFVLRYTKLYKESLKKLCWARRLLDLILSVPYVKGVFVTGSVASFNALPEDDIDLWIWTDPGRLFTTRLLLILTLKDLMRRRTDTNVKDKLCLNFFSALPVGKLFAEDLSFATQVVEAIPLYLEKVALYLDFLQANSWIARWYKDWYAYMLRELGEFKEQEYKFECDLSRFKYEFKARGDKPGGLPLPLSNLARFIPERIAGFVQITRAFPHTRTVGGNVKLKNILSRLKVIHRVRHLVTWENTFTLVLD